MQALLIVAFRFIVVDHSSVRRILMPACKDVFQILFVAEFALRVASPLSPPFRFLVVGYSSVRRLLLPTLNMSSKSSSSLYLPCASPLLRGPSTAPLQVIPGRTISLYVHSSRLFGEAEATPKTSHAQVKRPAQLEPQWLRTIRLRNRGTKERRT